jgi:hypothetical protein
MSQQLQEFSDSANAQAQAHLVDCRGHFFALANVVLSNYRYISNNCSFKKSSYLRGDQIL